MSALIQALDNATFFSVGENGHSQYTWSNSVQERIAQISFQLTRKRSSGSVIQQYDTLLREIDSQHKAAIIDANTYLTYMSILFRLAAQTRDIISGKGEYNLGYELVRVWSNFDINAAKYLFRNFMVLDDRNFDPTYSDRNGTSFHGTSFHPYGSWKDLKGYYLFSGSNVNDPIVQYGIELINQRLKLDANRESPSLAAKWVPREKPHLKDLYEALACDYFKEWIVNAKQQSHREQSHRQQSHKQQSHNAGSLAKAIKKAKTHYRKLTADLNRRLDTVQIKQCANTWAQIDPKKQTSITMARQKYAFLNKTKNGKGVRSENADRIECAVHFEEFAEEAVQGKVKVKGARVGINDFVKEALNINDNNSSEAHLLNAQWLDNGATLNSCAFGKMIAMVDVSESMCGEPMNAAIGLGIRVAEKSLLGKRVLTFSERPSWVNLDGCNDFISMVKKLRVAGWGMNTNFLSALNMILDAIVAAKMEPEDVNDMVLAVFSDMQIDQADRGYTTMYQMIEQKYADAGIRVKGKPYKPPHILFWNLRSTDGFPCLSTQPNVSMMSGFSPVLLNLFCEEGLNALQSCTPWSLFMKSIDNARYAGLDEWIRIHLED